MTRKKLDKDTLKEKVDGGILFSSGLIAGEGLIGILLAVLAIIPVGLDSLGETITVADKVAFGNNVLGQWGQYSILRPISFYFNQTFILC